MIWHERWCSNLVTCNIVYQVCQKYHWFLHKKHCERLKKEFDAREEANRKIAEKNKLEEEKKKKEEKEKLEEKTPNIEDVTDKEEKSAWKCQI